MPFETNLERNNRIYTLWEDGKTVDEISISMGIPRSSAGYYVRKFNQAARQGKTLPLPTKAKQEDVVQDFYDKASVAQLLVAAFKFNDPEKTYYYLASMKLFSELLPKIALTKKQKEMLDSALKDMGTTVSSSGQESAAEKGKHLDELFPAPLKGKNMATATSRPSQKPSSEVKKGKHLVDLFPDHSV